MANTISPNMGLIVPGVGTEPGPTWATDLNADLGILDQHNHASGQGVQITPAGLDINVDLPMDGNNLTGVKTVNFNSQLASLPGTSPNLGCVYVAGNELYYNDESGNVVQITNTGSVNAGAGSITGLPSGTASATYSSGSQTFIWQSATSTAANMDGGSIIIREVAASANGITISSPNSLAAPYTLNLPAALPGSLKILTLNSSGNIGDVLDVDNVTTEIVSNAISVKDEGITQAKLAPRASGTTVSAGGIAISASFTASTSGSGTFGPSITITTTGRPVRVFLQSASGVSQQSSVQVTGGGTLDIITQIYRDGTEFSSYRQTSGSSAFFFLPSSCFEILDMGVNGTPGTYVYSLGVTINPGAGASVTYNNCVLVAYEI